MQTNKYTSSYAVQPIELDILGAHCWTLDQAYIVLYCSAKSTFSFDAFVPVHPKTSVGKITLYYQVQHIANFRSGASQLPQPPVVDG